MPHQTAFPSQKHLLVRRKFRHIEDTEYFAEHFCLKTIEQNFIRRRFEHVVLYRMI